MSPKICPTCDERAPAPSIIKFDQQRAQKNSTKHQDRNGNGCHAAVVEQKHGGKENNRRLRCGRDLVPRLLTIGLKNLGRQVGRYPFVFIFTTLALTLIYGAAIYRNLVYITDIEYMYIPTTAQSWHDRAVAEQYFPVNFSGRFQPDRATRFGSFAHVLVYPKDRGNILRRDCFDEVN
jgi:hypothetical protein